MTLGSFSWVSTGEGFSVVTFGVTIVVTISCSLRLPVGTIKATGLLSEQSRNGCFWKAWVLRLRSCLIPTLLTFYIVPRLKYFGKTLVLLAREKFIRLRSGEKRGGGLCFGEVFLEKQFAKFANQCHVRLHFSRVPIHNVATILERKTKRLNLTLSWARSAEIRHLH